ncbi:hypothetical protein BD410DRAFT_722955 [Rickenella mellea]|uniref:PH domain-containing protein n=1 Tax=Rickenella mellea TaxID=50990 RepID=A0A4Y7Q4X5_9AGAM|nr:hypothetical protein BD410DRAFT_722955 [Rickenella mellea]
MNSKSCSWVEIIKLVAFFAASFVSLAHSTLDWTDLQLSIPDVAEPLFQVRLLGAIRSGDPAIIHPFLTEIGREKRESADDKADAGAAALHLAIRCAPRDTIALFLSHRAISPNAIHPPDSGTTALHLASSIGRADAVNLLLEQDDIDDAARDAQGRTAKDVARGKDVIAALRDSRSLLVASYRSLLYSYIHSPPSTPPPPGLIKILSSPRVRLVDLSYLDSSSGRSLLHEAARRKDLRLIELSVRAGADVFVRDRKGKAVGEGIGGGKDDKVRVFLRQFTNQDTTLLDSPTLNSEPPSLKGYLNKYTNVAKGYNTRWFVLKDGVLSYYRHQEDENVASRGSIAMKTAVLKCSSSPAYSVDKLRFEIHSSPSRTGSSTGQKWYIKGSHPVEVHRWTQAIARSIEWFGGKGRAGDWRRSIESSRTGSISWSGNTSFSSARSFYRKKSESGNHSPTSSTTSHEEADKERGSGDECPAEERELVRGILGDDERDGDQSDPDEGENLSEVSSQRAPPHESTFALHGSSTSAQMELTAQLLGNLALPPNPPPRMLEVRAALAESFAGVQKMLEEYLTMTQEREDWWRDKLEKERERGALWEESLQVVVKEGETLERELRSRVRGKRGDGTEGGGDATMKRRSFIGFKSERGSMKLDQPPTPKATLQSAPSAPSTPTASTTLAATEKTLHAPLPTSPLALDEEESLVDTDEEDEFFDAIESGNLPNLIVNKELTTTSVDELPRYVDVNQYEGYMHLRTKLPIENDTRPPTSLWSVLKHSIGKDLTKISFPVFFNEPTSMLQRMAEDMEFSECLDAAAAEQDPHRRIAFVAAFAMSNYSSTIGRIAKPFNPMLGETFEYVRLDKQYRYMSEQVSHHPPISACWAESPKWYYFGEVDAQNKFMGKSFEIRPTGVAHAQLKLPDSLGPGYPKATGPDSEGKVTEHYSWKKVTTNVSGFIIGSPTIDHYGEMTVTNHRTGDQCVLTFKPRGWRGKDAFEIYGRVMDRDGNVTYEIAGRWNGQLVAREVGTGFGALHPDVPVDGPSSPSTSQEFILLWRNTEKPTAPFNLTPFAITLNDCPIDSLKPYLCPTDCRLRPDQRAFELGKYDRANELKNKQEEFQRATRKAREEGRIPAHRPRWFEARTERDTGERLWEPIRVKDGTLEYWKEREWARLENRDWNNVARIFIGDEP